MMNRDNSGYFRWSVCPPSHRHTTDSEAAHCSALTAIFGPLRKHRSPAGKSRSLCAVPGCTQPRERNKRRRMPYCADHRREKIKLWAKGLREKTQKDSK